MEQHRVTITFPLSTAAEGNQLALSLAKSIRDTDPVVQVEIARDLPDALDFGATLVLILGTASATAVARGIGSWIDRQGGQTTIEVKSDGSFVGTRLTSGDAAKIVKSLSSVKTE
jgi:hypothetical protein